MSNQGKIDRQRPLNYDKESERHFYIRFRKDRSKETREYCCEHGKKFYRCKENEHCRNNYRTAKGDEVCGCGSGLTVRSCRDPDCDTEGSGSDYCKNTKKKKARCNCGNKGCGGGLCYHGKIKHACKECNEDYYVINYRYRLNNALKEKGRS